MQGAKFRDIQTIMCKASVVERRKLLFGSFRMWLIPDVAVYRWWL